MTSPSAALLAALSGPLEEMGVDLEEVDVSRAGRRQVVRIVIDRDGGVDLDLVARVSQRVSDLLDSAPLVESLPGPFVLEVTSPGVDRPLTQPRHWRRALTRLVDVELDDGSRLVGRISGLPDDDHVLVTTDAGATAVPLARVRRAVVQVEFNREADGHGDDQDDAVQSRPERS